MMRKEKRRRFVLMLLTASCLAVPLGGCVDWATIHREGYDKSLTVEEIDDGKYMISGSMNSLTVSEGYKEILPQSVNKKARDFCSSHNKAMKLINKRMQGGLRSTSTNLLGGIVMSGTDAEYEIVFTCRERTTPAAPAQQSKDADVLDE